MVRISAVCHGGLGLACSYKLRLATASAPHAWCIRSVSAIYCFNLEHPCLVRSRRDRVSRPRILYGFRVRRTPWRSCLPSDARSSTQCFHDTKVALVDRRNELSSRPNVEAFSSSPSVVDRPSDAPVAPRRCTGLRIPSHGPTHPHDAEIASKRDP
jgi:hypothetical protein